MKSGVLRIFKLLFELLGFEPINDSSRLFKIWLLIHTAFAITQLAMVLKFQSYIFYSFDPVGKTNDVVNMAATFFCYFTSIYVSWRYGRCYSEIQVEIRKIEALMEKLHVNINDVFARFYKSFIKKFFPCGVSANRTCFNIHGQKH